MLQAGVPTPPFCIMTSPQDADHGLRYPLVVKPRYEPSYALRIAERRRQLEKAVEVVLRRFRQEVLVEEHVRGRFISAALLGNDPVECLPLVELDAAAGRRICPAPLDDAVAERIRDLAHTTFLACHCRDFARVDLRLDAANQPYVLEVGSIGILDRGGAFALAASQAGYSFPDLVRRLVDIARERYRLGGGARGSVQEAETGSQQPLLDDPSRAPSRLEI
jgi:D-alanine-D-alanine ligase